MASSDATFKFVLIASIVVLLTLAAVSTLNCDSLQKNIEHKNNEAFFSSYANTNLNPAIDNYWKPQDNESIQAKFIANLFKLLNGSYPLVKLFESPVPLTQQDVFILAGRNEALNNLKIPLNTKNKDPYALAGFSDTTSIIPGSTTTTPGAECKPPTTNTVGKKEDIMLKFGTIEPITRPVQASEYLGDDARAGCGTISQTLNPDGGVSSTKVRVLDSYYYISSTCLRTQIMNVRTNEVDIFGSQSSAILNMLCPFAVSSFALFGTHKLVQVKDMKFADGKLNIVFDSSVQYDMKKSPPLYDHNPVSIVAYYLDYIGPIMDVTQSGGKNISMATIVDYDSGLVKFSGQQKLLSADNQKPLYTTQTAQFDFENFPKLGAKAYGESAKIYPGLVNPARLAVEYGFVYKTTSVDKIQGGANTTVSLDDFMMEYREGSTPSMRNIQGNPYPVDELIAQYSVIPQDNRKSCYNYVGNAPCRK